MIGLHTCAKTNVKFAALNSMSNGIMMIFCIFVSMGLDILSYDNAGEASCVGG